jgi:hypothetical protein
MSEQVKSKEKTYTQEELKKLLTEQLNEYRAKHPFVEYRYGVDHTGRYDIHIKIVLGDVSKGEEMVRKFQQIIGEL